MTTKLYYHKTDGGAEYLCTSPIEGTNEGDLHTTLVRLDGEPELVRWFPLYVDDDGYICFDQKMRDGETVLWSLGYGGWHVYRKGEDESFYSSGTYTYPTEDDLDQALEIYPWDDKDEEEEEE